MIARKEKHENGYIKQKGYKCRMSISRQNIPTLKHAINSIKLKENWQTCIRYNYKQAKFKAIKRICNVNDIMTFMMIYVYKLITCNIYANLFSIGYLIQLYTTCYFLLCLNFQNIITAYIFLFFPTKRANFQIFFPSNKSIHISHTIPAFCSGSGAFLRFLDSCDTSLLTSLLEVSVRGKHRLAVDLGRWRKTGEIIHELY